MKPISMIYAVSGILTMLASANVASAGSVVVHTTTPMVTVHPTVTPLVTGGHIPKGTITIRKNGGDSATYYDKNKSGDDRPQESMSLNFSNIKTDYKTQK